ncbi:MAG: hypothetical protein GY796_14015 [Chloroflexi bacterium]|nr:hypothetical protein [Chloroflexota bacterium]
MSIAQESPPDKVGQITCPYCNSTDNELFSLFGQTLIGSQYYCNNCHTVFESVRWKETEEIERPTIDD